jgi:hypothetical protein
MYLMQKVVADQIKDFEAFPPRQKPASFNLDAVMRQFSTVPRPTQIDGAHDGDGTGSKIPPSTNRVASRDRTRSKTGQP